MCFLCTCTKKAVFRIRDVYPGSRIRIFSIPDPGSGSASASKNLNILTQKNVSTLSEIRFRMFIPDSDFGLFTNPGSRGQIGTGSQIRIRNTEKSPLNWFNTPGTVQKKFIALKKLKASSNCETVETFRHLDIAQLANPHSDSDTGNHLRQRPRPCLNIPRQQWQTSFSGKALCSLSTTSARGRRLAVENMVDIFEPPLKPAISGGMDHLIPPIFPLAPLGLVSPRRCKCQKAARDLWTYNFVTQSCRIKNREEQNCIWDNALVFTCNFVHTKLQS